MKKLPLLAAASILAIALSVYASPKSNLTLYYESSPGIFTEIPPEVEPCPPGNFDQCVLEINGQFEPIWKDAGITAYKKN